MAVNVLISAVSVLYYSEPECLWHGIWPLPSHIEGISKAGVSVLCLHWGADKSLARPGRKQTTATEDFDFHISYL